MNERNNTSKLAENAVQGTDNQHVNTINSMANESTPIDRDEVRIAKTSMRDTDSMAFGIECDGLSIGYGHLNMMSNMAHVALKDEDQDLEDWLVEMIESYGLSLGL